MLEMRKKLQNGVTFSNHSEMTSSERNQTFSSDDSDDSLSLSSECINKTGNEKILSSAYMNRSPVILLSPSYQVITHICRSCVHVYCYMRSM